MEHVAESDFVELHVQIILRKVLQNLNIQCDEAENGQVAVDFYKEGRTYDLVLMDKEMPVMDGHEATRQLRSMGVKTPIVALTGNALTTDRELFFEAGVDDFQTKVQTLFFLSMDSVIERNFVPFAVLPEFLGKVSLNMCLPFSVMQPLSREKLVQLLVRYGVESTCSKSAQCSKTV